MDRDAVLAAFDRQLRREPGPDGPEGRTERDEHVLRHVPNQDGSGWAGVTWSDLDATNADQAIAAQKARFADYEKPWEWKHYSYDRPVDLPERLAAAGFVAEPTETLMVAEIALLPLDQGAPEGVVLIDVVDATGVDLVVAVHDAVFGGDHSDLGAELTRRLADDPRTAAAVVAVAGTTPIASGRVEFHLGSEFASLWGGGTLSQWRGRGVFRSLVAHRAAQASALGFRYLQVDASDESRPILERLGFAVLASTTPFVFTAAGARPQD